MIIPANEEQLANILVPSKLRMPQHPQILPDNMCKVAISGGVSVFLVFVTFKGD